MINGNYTGRGWSNVTYFTHLVSTTVPETACTCSSTEYRLPDTTPISNSLDLHPKAKPIPEWQRLAKLKGPHRRRKK